MPLAISLHCFKVLTVKSKHIQRYVNGLGKVKRQINVVGWRKPQIFLSTCSNLLKWKLDLKGNVTQKQFFFQENWRKPKNKTEKVKNLREARAAT